MKEDRSYITWTAHRRATGTRIPRRIDGKTSEQADILLAEMREEFPESEGWTIVGPIYTVSFVFGLKELSENDILDDDTPADK